MKRIRKNCRGALAAGALLGALAALPLSAATAGTVEVSDAWIRLAPPNMKVHAAYFTLLNAADKPRQLVAAESASYDKVELHISREINGVAMMEHLAQVEIPASGTVEFKPGGLHVMLIGAKAPQTENATVPLTLVFANGEKLDVTATIRKGTGKEEHGTRGSHMGH